jgi:glycosyltransferase involved in cell wall biosynthesis
MTIDIIYPALPPTLNGIADHTFFLARALAQRGCEVRVLTAQRAWDPIPGVNVTPCFSVSPPHRIRDVVAPVVERAPDWVLLQFEQFSYGHWGFNPFLPAALRRLKQRCPDTRLGWIVHEDFASATDWRSAIWSTWQRPQFWALGQVVDAMICCIEPWATTYQDWFPHLPVHHIPVGSNMPLIGLSSPAARQALDYSPDDLVVGVFGGGHPSRLLSFVRDALHTLTDAAVPWSFLYVGADGVKVRRQLPGVPILDTGALPAADVSRHLAAVDLYLAPFANGVSTRRGSFLAGIQHGLATVSTHGPRTDPLLLDENGHAFELVPDDDPSMFARTALALAQSPNRRRTLGRAAHVFFEDTFAWPRIADQFLRVLGVPSPSIPVSSASPS